MNAKTTFSLILLTSFASLLHGMDGQKKLAKKFASDPPLVKGSLKCIPGMVNPSGDNRRVVVQSDDGYTVQLHSSRTAWPRGDQFKHAKSVIHMILSPCNRWLATTVKSNAVLLWKIKAGTCAAVHELPSVDIDDSLVFSPSGAHLALVTAHNEMGVRGCIRIWKTEQPEKPCLCHEAPEKPCLCHEAEDTYKSTLFTSEYTFAYAAIKKVCGVNKKSSVRVLDIQEDQLSQRTEMLCGTSYIQNLVQASKKPHIIAAVLGYTNYTTRLWNTNDGTPPTEDLLNLPHTDAVALSPNGDYLALSHAMTLRLYKLNPQLTAASEVWHTQLVPEPDFEVLWWSANGSILGADAEDNVIRLKPSDGFRQILGCKKQRRKKKKKKAARQSQATDSQ